MSSYETVPKIAEAIRRCLKTDDEIQINAWASAIYDEFDLCRVLEDMERSDRTSERDIVSLSDAIKHLDKAVNSLKEIGWHGGKALQPSATRIRKQSTRFGFGVGVIEAPRVFANHLASMKSILEMAILEIPEDAMSVNSAFGEGPEFGRRTTKRPKIAAKQVALTCANAYQQLAGSRPTVSTDLKNRAYGPFLDFVQEIFSILGELGSAETWARAAVKVKAGKVKGPDF